MTLKDRSELQDQSAFPVRIELRCLYADMDAFRHVNNGAIGRYFEEGRADLNIRMFGPACMTDPGDMQLLFASSSIDYLAQVSYPGMVCTGSGIERIGNSSWTLIQGLFQNGVCCALTKTVMVKALAGKPEPLSEAERASMSQYLIV